jgi:hypothetical protein
MSAGIYFSETKVTDILIHKFEVLNAYSLINFFLHTYIR